MDGTPVGSNWVYGGIFPNNDGGDFAIIYQQEPEIEKFPVYSDTVGQYTGLTDKNGKKIFEGDILKLEDYHGHRVVHVFYGKSCGCWFYGGDRFSDEYIFNGQFKEVIGNIFDNPELLTED